MTPTVNVEIVKAIAMLCQLAAGDQPSMNNQAYINEARQIRCHAYYVDCLDRQPPAAKNAQRGLANCMLDRGAELEPKGTK